MAGRALAAALALVILCAGAAWLRLRAGPVDLAFLQPRLQAAVAAATDGARLEIGALAFSLGDEAAPAPGLRAEGLRLSDANGRTLFAAPVAQIGLDPTALIGGRIRPTSVTVMGPALRLTREADGRFRLGVGAPPTTVEGPPPEPDEEAAAALGGAGAAIEAFADAAPGPLEGLRSVSIVDARLIYDDYDSGRRWRARRADLRVERRDGALSAVLAATLPRASGAPTVVRAEGVRATDGGARMRLGFSGASPQDLVAQFPALAGLEALDAPLQGRAEVAIDGSGRLTTFDATLRAAAGAIKLRDAALPFSGGSVAFSLDPAARAFTVRRFALDAEHGAIAGSARVDVETDAAGAPSGLLAQVDVDRLSLSPPGLFAAPARFDAAALSARVQLDPLRIDVAQADLARGRAHVVAEGFATLVDGAWRGEARLGGGGLSAEDLVALWPLPAAPGARAWLSENLESGEVTRLDGFARFGPDGPDGALTFAFRDAVAHYFRPLPPIERASGWGEIDPVRFEVALDAGVVRPPGGGEVDLSGSVMTLPDLDDPLSTSDVVVRGGGPVAAILEVLDYQPLGFVSTLGLDPRSVEGEARAVAALRLPLLKDLKLDQIAVDVDAALTGVALEPPDTGVRLSDAAVALRATTASLTAEGTGSLDGAPVRFGWTETFDPAPGAVRSRYAVAGRLSQARLEALGLDARPYLLGPVGAEATIEQRAEGVSIAATLDLAPATLSAGALGWEKPPGRPGRAQIEARVAEDGAVALERIEVEADGLAAAGSARIRADGGLAALKLDRLRVAEALDVAVSLTREADGMRAEIDGALIDVAALAGRAAADGAGADAATLPRLTGSLRLDALRLSPQFVLQDAAGALTRSPGGGRRLDVGGRLGGAQVRVQAVEAETADAPIRALVTADDAGAALRAAGLFPDGVGGALRVDADVTLVPAPLVVGEVAIEGMSVVNDPALRRMLAQAASPPPEAEGVRFDRIRAPFRLTTGGVTLDEAVAYGPTVGLSVSGDYDFGRDALDVQGVFSPAFALNSAVGAIPLLGDLLTGGEGRGLVAFNFAVRGPADDPDVTVNPLSVLTPGVLRRLFEGGLPPPRG